VIPAAAWRVAEVRTHAAFRLRVRFVDGTEGDVDMASLIMDDNAGVFSVLRDPLRFAQARVIEGVVTWPGDLDIAPDAMYDEIREHGAWTIKPFTRGSTR
jgi:Protein of unknown function (DUF2442)